MDRVESARVIGWIDSETGDECRRNPFAIKKWRYTHRDIPGFIIFALDGVHDKVTACEIGHQLLKFKIFKEGNNE